MTEFKIALVWFFVFILAFIIAEGAFPLEYLIVFLMLPLITMLVYAKRSIITNLFGEVQKPKK